MKDGQVQIGDVVLYLTRCRHPRGIEQNYSIGKVVEVMGHFVTVKAVDEEIETCYLHNCKLLTG